VQALLNFLHLALKLSATPSAMEYPGQREERKGYLHDKQYEDKESG
jgi:hypothetical protein